jgi:hypothetical protein
MSALCFPVAFSKGKMANLINVLDFQRSGCR